MSDFVECQICGKKFKQIISAHTNKHGMSLNDYKKKFPNALIVGDTRQSQFFTMKGIKRPEHSKLMSGQNNPMYGRKRTNIEKKKMSQNRTGKGIGVAGKYERTDEILKQSEILIIYVYVRGGIIVLKIKEILMNN